MPPAQALHPVRQILFLMFILVGFWYLNWRLDTFNAAHPLFSRILYAAEVFGFFTALLNAFMTWRLTVRDAPAPRPGMKVDVFIPTYNEDVDLVRRTALAAREMDYPHQTWILDDGNRPAMRAMAESLGVRYLARTDNQDAKAGNLNHALAWSDADLIATFDADHAPRRDFLQKTLGYFNDERVAFVQTPQDFYNLDSYQNRTDGRRRVAWSEQSLFFRVIQRGKDYWNSAFYCGSCAVIRRRSLDDIGGFATGTVTEDIHTSLKLHKRGWRSVYHAESLAYGVAPAKVEPFLKQRIRWGVGAMNVWRKEGILFTPGLTLPQRLSYLATVLAYFDGWQKGFFYFAPVYVLMAGAMPIAVDGWVFLLHFIPYYALNFLAFEEISRGYGRSVLIEQYNMARFAGFAWSTLGLFRIRRRFGVTAKKADVQGGGLRFMLPQAAVVIFNALAVPVGIVLFYRMGHLPAEGMWANVFWAAVNTALGARVLQFTQGRDRNRRGEYRFAVPLPARLANSMGTVDDLSPEGMRFYGKAVDDVDIGARIAGTIYLPDGALDVLAEVRDRVEAGNDRGRYVRAVGLKFVGLDDRERIRIEQFLYGSDAQWRINRLREATATPLQRLGLVPRDAMATETPNYWAACGIACAGPEHFGLAGSLRTPGHILLAVFEPLAEGRPCRVEVFSRHGARHLVALPARVETLTTGSGDVHLYRAVLQGSDVASDPITLAKAA